jgi:hypothetical protein
MIHFPKGEDWKDPLPRRHWDKNLEDLLLDLKANAEGLPDRWLQIVEMKVRWGWTGTRLFLLDEPEAHCVKEGLWKW